MSDVMRTYDRSKEMGNRKRIVMSTRQRGEGSSNEQNEERRKKRKEEGERKKHAEWVASLQKRKVTCETQVCEHSLGENQYIAVIREKGMKHYFKEVKGYVKNWVVDFFTHMQYNSEQTELETTVGGVDIVVNPDVVASYLGYARPMPETITYPRPGDEDVDMNEVYAAVFEGGVHAETGGDLRDEYGTMNKVLHYNLFPRGMEKTPYEQELELLYVFLNDNETMDYAKWIFDQLVQFKHGFKKGLNFPFPAVITQLCLANDLSLDGQRLDPSSPGVINATSEHKSKTNVTRMREARAQAQAQAQAQVDTQAGPSQAPSVPAPQKKGSTLKKLLCKLLCRTAEIQEDQRRADHKASFYYEAMAEQTGRRYEPPVELVSDRAIGEHRSPEYPEDELTEDEIRELEQQYDPGMFERSFGPGAQ